MENEGDPKVLWSANSLFRQGKEVYDPRCGAGCVTRTNGVNEIIKEPYVGQDSHDFSFSFARIRLVEDLGLRWVSNAKERYKTDRRRWEEVW